MYQMIVGFFFMMLSSLSFCGQEELKATLVRIINQLNATLPLLDEAEEEIEPNSRIRLHIKSFEGADNKTHSGVRDDVVAIRNGLIEYINKPAVEPKTIKPIQFDFIGK